MPKWKIRIEGKADVYRDVIVEGEDLDTCCDEAETKFADELQGWSVEEISRVSVNEFRKLITTEWVPMRAYGAWYRLVDHELFYCPMFADGSRDASQEGEVDFLMGLSPLEHSQVLKVRKMLRESPANVLQEWIDAHSKTPMK